MCICIELLATHKGPRAGVMVPWVKSLLRQHEGLSLIPRTHVCLFVCLLKSGIVTYVILLLGR